MPDSTVDRGAHGHLVRLVILQQQRNEFETQDMTRVGDTWIVQHVQRQDLSLLRCCTVVTQMTSFRSLTTIHKSRDAERAVTSGRACYTVAAGRACPRATVYRVFAVAARMTFHCVRRSEPVVVARPAIGGHESCCVGSEASAWCCARAGASGCAVGADGADESARQRAARTTNTQARPRAMLDGKQRPSAVTSGEQRRAGVCEHTW